MQCSVAGSLWSTFKPPSSSGGQHRQGHCSCWWPFHWNPHSSPPWRCPSKGKILQLWQAVTGRGGLLHKASVGVNRNITCKHSNVSISGDPHWTTQALGLLWVIKHIDQLPGSYSRLHTTHLPFLLYFLSVCISAGAVPVHGICILHEVSSASSQRMEQQTHLGF